jgi:hypothetical protein
LKVEKCPICGSKGSLHKRWVYNKLRKRYEPYFYMAHWVSGTGKIRWCYVDRKTAAALMRDTLSNTLTPEAILNAEPGEELDRGKVKWPEVTSHEHK